MITLEELRKEIEKIDETIINELAKRKNLVVKIGGIKEKEGKEILDQERENQLMKRYSELSKQYGLQNEFIENLFKLIMTYSKEVQKHA